MKYIKTQAINTEEIETALGSEVFKNRELVKSHTRYSQELRFYNLIKNGDIEALLEALKIFTSDTIGHMSKNPLRQQMYEFVAGITLITRFSIEGGLGEEDAFHISDIYIQKADACTTTADIWSLYQHMILDFARRVHALQKTTPVSAPIQLAMDYIFNHLHYKISLPELADYTGFGQTYLCYLFKKETGNTITEFIHKKRVAEAESLLRYSEYSLAEISQYLGFCSQSHFTSIFRKYTTITPIQFRKTYFRRNWSS